MREWSTEWVMHKLGKPLDWWPDGGMYSAEAEQVLQQAINLLKADTVSGYQEVYKVGGKWQAKPYVSPGVQRSLGMFDDPQLAAKEVLWFKIGVVQLPPTPKPRNKRGAGRKPRSRVTIDKRRRAPALSEQPEAAAMELSLIHI